MKRLFEGTVKFRDEYFNSHRDLFEELGDSQFPHTLFIGCSDSRLVPSLITQTLPGELFIIRNIANMVPPFNESKEFSGITAAIEYAVKVLKVKNILVCGHSNCGGCYALYKDNAFFEDLPNTRHWLELGSEVREKVLRQIDPDDKRAREWLTEQYNIIEQILHLLSYPFISEKVESGELEIFGWYYIISTGEIYNYNPEKENFELIN